MNTNVSPIIPRAYYIDQQDYPDIQLGTSDETVYSAGCYVSSIAMIICWYIGNSSSATKKAVLKKLAANCDSDGGYNGGRVSYGGHTFSTMTISDMAQELLNGYPSIAKVSGTKGTHFVVVNGYNTSGSTTYECYLVLDPGWDYDNLQQVLNVKKATKIASKIFVQMD